MRRRVVGEGASAGAFFLRRGHTPAPATAVAMYALRALGRAAQIGGADAAARGVARGVARADVGEWHAAVVAEVVWGGGAAGRADVGEGGVDAVVVGGGGGGGEGGARRGRGFGGGFFAQLLAAGLVPGADLGVGLGGEGGGGDGRGERLAGVWVAQVPVLDGVEDEGHVLFRGEQDLDGLPAHEAAEGDGGDGGGLEVPGGVVVAVGGLEGVAAAEDLPNVGDGLVGRVDEEFCVTGAKRAVS